MLRVTATDAKNSLGSILAKVKEGETFLITSRGEPVATIAPVYSDVLGDKEDRIKELVAAGVMSEPLEPFDIERLRSMPKLEMPRGMNAVDLINLERDGR